MDYLELRRKLAAIHNLLENTSNLGEQKAALEALKRLSEKYDAGVESEAFEPEETTLQEFKVKNAHERTLLHYCVSSVTGTFRNVSYRRRNGRGNIRRNVVLYELTNFHGVMVDMLFDYHSKILPNVFEEALVAYVHANELLPPPSDSLTEDDDEMSVEERERISRIARMVGGMKTGSPSPQLESGNDGSAE